MALEVFMDEKVVEDVYSDMPLTGTHLANQVLDEISKDACNIAAEKGSAIFKTFKGGTSAFYPSPDYEAGEAGVGINEDYHYLIYQENGFQSFSMKALYGKTIPMMIDGVLIFRKVTNINQFRSGKKTYWIRNQDGELMPEYKQARSWVHPGHKPVEFISEAIDESIDKHQEDIDYAYVGGMIEWINE
jgi:hypothetical protein